MTIYYMSLESYQARYTLQLTEWNRRVFDRRGLDVVYVDGETLDTDQQIVTGQVLDAHGRSYYSLSQMMNLVKFMKEGKVTNQDVVYFEDLFTPGFESLGYIINQVPDQFRPRIFVRCLAQSIDPDDFIHVWGMQNWMSDYERMVNKIVSDSNGAILASNEEMIANMKIAGWTAKLYNISGLAFGKEEVLERLGNYSTPFHSRKQQVVFGSRFDQEKLPHFFMDIIDRYLDSHGEKSVIFTLCSGGPLRSNDASAVVRARKMQESGRLNIQENLKKNEYYDILDDSRVLIATSLQDWTSNCISEADTLGANILFPAYRSFPEIMANDHERMYIPWSIDDAVTKLDRLIQNPHCNIGKVSDWTDGTIGRIIDIIEGKGEQWARMSTDYRNHTIEDKYQ